MFAFAPATLITATPEAFFSTCALLGHISLFYSSRAGNGAVYLVSVLAAACAFSIATAFRANGLLLTGFVIWTTIWSSAGHADVIQRAGKVLLTIAASAIVILPFISGQVWAHDRFCRTDASVRRPWCSRSSPAIYSYVQSTYW